MFPTPTIGLLAIWLVVATSSLPLHPGPGSHGDDERPVVHLTFDGGPGPRTAEFLDILDQWDAQATFFVVGVNARNSPEMVTEITRRGHAIGNNSWSPRDLTRLATLEAATELAATNRVVAELGGGTMRCWRHPLGRADDELVDLAASVGLSNESWIPSGGWDVDTDDLNGDYAAVLSRLEAVGPGDVVVMNGGMNPDHEDLAALMTWFEANGDDYRFEAIPGCEPGDAAAPPPGELAAVDSLPGLLATDPDLWFDVQRGSVYLGAFGSTD